MLVQGAKGATKKKKSYYRAKYNSLRFQLGSHQKATVAIANRIARAVYYIIKLPEERFKDIGEQRVDPRENQVRRAVAKLKQLGFKVELNELTKAAVLAQETTTT
jgi:phage terminase Nu1 subunit (DNA packaging protein)